MHYAVWTHVKDTAVGKLKSAYVKCLRTFTNTDMCYS